MIKVGMLALDLYKVSRLLLNENEVAHVSKSRRTKKQTLKDFEELKSKP